MIFLLLPHDTNKYHTLIIMCLFNYTSSTLDSFVLWMTHFFPSSFFLLSFNPVDEEEALMKHFNIFLFSMSRERESIFVYISSLRLSKWLLESYVKYVPEDRTSRTNMNEVKREKRSSSISSFGPFFFPSLFILRVMMSMKPKASFRVKNNSLSFLSCNFSSFFTFLLLACNHLREKGLYFAVSRQEEDRVERQGWWRIEVGY